jgi:putative membrane protein
VTEQGDRPRLDIDIRFLLANERTLLAWLRTALTLLAGGVALLQLADRRLLLHAVGIGLLVLGSLAGGIGYRRYRAAGAAIHAGALPAPGVWPALLTAAVIGLVVVYLLG